MPGWTLLALPPTAGHAAATVAAVAPAAPVGFSPSDGYRMVRDWDFARDVVDSALDHEFATRYIYAGGSLDHLNDEWSRYRDRDNHVFTAGGLSLVARAGGALAPGAIESGMLRSKWTGEYGYFEIRMKVPRGRGLWPAFWLNPQDQKWPPEIDVVEIVNNGRDDTRRGFCMLASGSAFREAVRSLRLDRDQTFTSWRRLHRRLSRARRPNADARRACATWSTSKPIADRALTRWAHDDGSDGRPRPTCWYEPGGAAGSGRAGPPRAPARTTAALEIEYIHVWQRRAEASRR